MKHSRKVNQRGGARLDRSITLFQTQLLELNLEVEVLPNYRQGLLSDHQLHVVPMFQQRTIMPTILICPQPD